MPYFVHLLKIDFILYTSRDMSKKELRPIYNKKHYKALELLRNPKFQRRIRELKKVFKCFGCPVPKDGFEKYADYQAWVDNYWDTYSKYRKSDGYKVGIHKITGGQETFGLKEFNKIEKFENRFLPPIYGAVLSEILAEFGVDKNDPEFKDFIEYYVFLGRDRFPTELFRVSLSRENNKRELQMFIQLYGHTRKEDITDNWDFITKYQKDLLDYKQRNRKREEFERDNKIYEYHLKLKEKRQGKRAKNGELSLEEATLSKFSKRYPYLNIEVIRGIVRRVKGRRGNPKEVT